MMNEPSSFTIGPSMVTLMQRGPRSPLVPSNSFVLPSFVRISSTDERRPPYSAGMPLCNDFDIFNGIGIEAQREAEQMERLVHRRFIKHDQVLIDTAATSIKAFLSFPSRLDSGEQLNRFQNIFFTQQHRNRLHLVHFKAVRTHFCRRDVFIRPPRRLRLLPLP